jgi:class 3 adenylate cyclase
MSSDDMKLGECIKVIFRETEYDVFEQKIILLSDPHDIYRTAAEFIISRMKPDFVMFYAGRQKSESKVQYCIKQKKTECNINQYMKERRSAAVDDDSAFMHPSGCLSIPYKPGSGSSGCIYIGPSGGNNYTCEQAKPLIPLIRILNKALLYHEAEMARNERNWLQEAFSHYVSPAVVQNILQNPDMIHLGGEKKFLTCIFTDLRGFTTLSEKMDPILLVRVLNMYLTEMSQVIMALGGTIDKFEGDAIMAFFGAPHELKDHAVRCCLAALRMKRMEKVLNDQLMREGLIEVPLFTRIGINSGDMVVGNVGSIQRLDYTVIGGNVNIASRLETANKEYNTSILISGATYELVKSFFICSSLGYISLKGVKNEVDVFELVEQKDGVNLEYTNFSGEWGTIPELESV